MNTPIPISPAWQEWFVHGYVTILLWSSHDESTESGGEPMDAKYDKDDFDPLVMRNIREDCNDFMQANIADLRAFVAIVGDHPDMNAWARAGGDFWLTRCGHGVGYWDRGAGPVGDRLSEAARLEGSLDAYIGDDGKVYVSGMEGKIECNPKP